MNTGRIRGADSLSGPAPAPGEPPSKQDGFGGVFNPQNLQTAPGAPPSAPAPAPAPQKPRDDGFGGVFNPQNLQTAPAPPGKQ
jgi:hypothetical protein